MIYSNIQKQILQKLLTKYESSKTYKGENIVLQSFSIKPSDVFKNYEKDATDINEIQDFEKQCSLLESEKLIQLEFKYERITRITAITSDKNWSRIRSILGVKDKNTRLKEEIFFYSSFYEDASSHQIVKDFCMNQIERLKIGKEAEFILEDAKDIISLLSFILGNKNEILERELSILVLSNSKNWELKYKTKVLKILMKSGLFDSLTENCSDEKEKNKVILEECNIYSNPSYVYFKGNGSIVFKTGYTIKTTTDIPLAISSASIKNISSFEIFDSKIMTVENLTSFNRIDDSDTFYIFLSGYHNTAKQTFLKTIFNQNQNKEYSHFSDIDAGGFYILEHLKKKTGIDFHPKFMDVATLIKHEKYWSELTENDKKRLNDLLKQHSQYNDVISFMLENNCRLEQEAVRLSR